MHIKVPEPLMFRSFFFFGKVLTFHYCSIANLAEICLTFIHQIRNNPMEQQKFWGKYTFKVNQTRLFKAGYAEVYIKRVTNGWLVKTGSSALPVDNMVTGELENLDDDQDVLHFYSGSSSELILVPALPDKAVVFRNNKNIKVSASKSTRLFFTIPLTMQFYFDEIKDENRLVEVPLRRLSDTWFGEMDSGEPAYSIGSNYYKSLTDVDARVWEAIASVEIINNTFGVLDLQRLILRVEEFNLYRKDEQILTNHVAIEFKGQEQVESVNLSIRGDVHGDQFETVANKRLSDSRKLLRRSFFFIKNIYQN